MNNLLVYTASAGSGKTHQITGEYVSMLLRKKNKAYKNILAVTFTNKASEEMKSRIIADLAINNNCKEIFKEILHDYSFFSISTIDSFFQKILRNFTREIGLDSNYEIELDNTKIIDKAVDNLLLHSENDKTLKQNIISLVEQNIEDGKKWDFRKTLKDFITEVLKSNFKSYEEEYNAFFSDKNNSNKLKHDFNLIINNFESTIYRHIENLNLLLKAHNLTISNFSGGDKSSIIKRLLNTIKAINKTDFNIESHFKNIDNINKWLKNDDIDKLSDITNKLITESEYLKTYFEENYKHYFTAQILKRQINFAALINYSLLEIRSYLNETGKFLISDVPQFLSEITSINDTPFIYEKIGSFYENYLIDEFQDTSKVQWDSFYPLLNDSLSSGNENVIVGDVKQSIYAWRGGDWNLLSEHVPKYFKDFVIQKNLADNYRSGRNIVEFNNFFFEKAADILVSSNIISEDIKEKLYQKSNIEQNVKKDFNSLVNISFFEPEKLSNGQLNLNDFKERAIYKMITQIEEIQEKGHNAADILILVRTKAEGSLIAEKIIEYSQSSKRKANVIYDVISSESLFISSNKAVQLIISFFKYLINDNDNLSFAEIVYIYYLQNKDKNDNTINFDFQQLQKQIDNKIETLKNNLKHKQLHDITDSIIYHLKLNANSENVPFLNSFRDIIHEYEQKNTSNIQEFLKYWEDTGIEKNLKIPEKQNAINIITIHKAKGLAEDFVFIPFCFWNFYKSGDTIWSESNNIEPFNVLPVWAIKAKQNLENTIFESSFTKHKLKNTVESLNLMYVAFTRARKGLFVYAPQKSDGEFNNVGKLLNKIFDTKDYSTGKIDSINKKTAEQSYFDEYPVFLPDKQIKIKSYFDKNKFDPQSDSSIHKGIVYHKIFEKIKTLSDVKNAISELNNNGIILNEDVEKYNNEINEILSNEYIKSWFDGSYIINNEIEIISKNHLIFRPDRIMEKGNEIVIVDYKFGEKKEQKHIKQINEYSELLKDMGYKNVKAYIWYVMQNEIVDSKNRCFF